MIAFWLLNMPVYGFAIVFLCMFIFEVIRRFNLVKIFIFKSDENISSPYDINTLPHRQLKRITKTINKEILTWFRTIFSVLALRQMSEKRLGEFLFRAWTRTGLNSPVFVSRNKSLKRLNRTYASYFSLMW